MTEGWASTGRGRQPHYFVNGRAKCDQLKVREDMLLFRDTVPLNPCKKCWKKLEEE